MKRELRGIMLGILITLMITTAFASGITKSISVQFNSVNLEVNGQKVEADTILYEGTTYVPIRAAAEILEKEVGWSGSANTASINDKTEGKDQSETISDSDEEDEEALVEVIGNYTIEYGNLNGSFNNKTLIKVDANPEQGFNYPYFLYLPRSVDLNKNGYMIVEPNNTGTSSDDLAVHESRAYREVDNNWLAEALDSPILIPVFPRPRTQPDGVSVGGYAYTHSLCRQTLKVDPNENLYRVDLQLIEMIDNARELLSQNGLDLQKKVFMHGYSASGTYLPRFAQIHPERVKAIAAGGLNGMPNLPVKEYEGNLLTYPVGVGDIYELTGKEFNLEEYKKVAQYLHMGYLDKNDTLPYSDAFDENERQIIKEILGEHMIYDRWEKSKEIYNSVGVNAQFVEYYGVYHELRREMRDDIIKFFKANSEQEIVHIDHHQYEYFVPEKIKSLKITKALWRNDPNLAPGFKRMYDNGTPSHFLIYVEGLADRVPPHIQMREFANYAGFRFDLVSGDQVIRITQKDFGGTATKGTYQRSESTFQVQFRNSQDMSIDYNKEYKLVVYNIENSEYKWELEDDVILKPIK